MPSIVKKTIDSIVAGGNYYCIGVKENQPTLYKQIEEHIHQNGAIPIDVYETNEKNKGRIENRQINVYQPININIDTQKWQNIQTIIAVNTFGNRPNHNLKTSYQETRYYISNYSPQSKPATFFNTNIRNHWQIENGLHYQKDVYMGEDEGRLKTKNAAAVCATLRNIVFNFSVFLNRSVKYLIEHWLANFNTFFRE